MRLLSLFVLLSFGILGCRPATPTVPVFPDTLRAQVAAGIAEVDAMRVTRAAGIGEAPVDTALFRQVCMPVGKQAQALGAANGWTVRQISAKNRNPKNALDAEAAALYARFTDDPARDTLWVRSTLDGQPGTRFFQRIRVEASCLACHGPRDARPAFVVARYPDDRAYDFQPGDLRGLYSVFVPDSVWMRPADNRPADNR